MEIILNNRKESFEGSRMNIEDLLKAKNFTFKLLVTKVNGKLIKKEERAGCLIHDGDDVTVLHMISGG